MMLLGNRVKQMLGIGAFGAALLFAARATANVQGGYYDPYYGQGNRYYNQNRQTSNEHRKQEKRAVIQHQRDERDYYGNSRQVRRHQDQERRQVKEHERNERNNVY